MPNLIFSIFPPCRRSDGLAESYRYSDSAAGFLPNTSIRAEPTFAPGSSGASAPLRARHAFCHTVQQCIHGLPDVADDFF